MKYKVVILDLDNTLIDFDKMENASIIHCLKTHNLPFDDDKVEAYIKINKMLWEGLELGKYQKPEILTLRFEKWLTQFNLTGDPVSMNETFLAGIVDHLTMMESADKLLEYVKDKYIVVMMTNGVTTSQNAKLEKGQLRHYFDHIIISDEVGSHKPDSAIFEHMESLVGAYDKSEIIIVGDSLTSDIKGGINYRIDTCWFNPKGLRSDMNITHDIRHLNELFEIL